MRLKALWTLGDQRRQGPLARVGSALLDLVLPLSCVGCRMEGSALCEACQARLPRLREPFCRLCARLGATPVCRVCYASPLATDGIRAPYLHEGDARRLIHGLKYANARAYAVRMAGLMADSRALVPTMPGVVVPVPLHRRRQQERGYNQSELLARGLGRILAVPVDSSALRRIRDTPPQVSLDSAEERRRNIEGAFECRVDMAGAHVLLVDDVVTTGATMSACASALKGAGAVSVWGVAFARQPPPE